LEQLYRVGEREGLPAATAWLTAHRMRPALGDLGRHQPLFWSWLMYRVRTNT
jgi:hypothetical protein